VIGQLIGNRYRILRKVGEGGMAVVHIAVDEKLGRDIAIKILKERYENNGEIRTRFQHEAHAISTFDHHNILKIYDYSGEDSRQLWIVTELIHGRNLAQILGTTPSGWLHPLIAASIVREICRALVAAHEHGIVHRDVKPENVMITHNGTVKLMDFGIAKIQRISSMTQTGIFMGSPSYMSPEQVRGRDVDHRSDIYSLGVLFYELVTGKLPYTAPSTADIAMRILSGEYVHPKFIMEGIPTELESCIVRCLELLPDDRYPTIETIGLEIDQVLESFKLDNSQLELERCFKDPKAYGERLSKLFKAIAPSPTATVIDKSTARHNYEAMKSPIPRPDIDGHLSDGSAQRKALLPQRQSPQNSKERPSVELIEAHLPNRRQHQRDIKARQHTKSAAEVSLIHPVHKGSAPKRNPDFSKQNPRTIRPVSRIVPPTPRKANHHVRYVIHSQSRSPENPGFFLKFFVAILAIICFGFFGPRLAKISKSKFGTQVSSVKRIKNRTTPAVATQSPPAIVGQSPSKPAPEISAPEISAPKDATIEILPPKMKTSPKPALKDLSIQAVRKKQTAQSVSSVSKSTKVTAARPSAADTSDRSTQDTHFSSEKISVATVPEPEPPSANLDAQDPTIHEAIPVIVPPAKLTPTKVQRTAKGKGKISISSSPAAELSIDGKRVGTTNDQGSSSGWIDVLEGSHRIDLKRSGFAIRTETITAVANDSLSFGPYSLVRGDNAANTQSLLYRLTLSTNTPPVRVSIINIENQETQTFTLAQPTQVITLTRGIYDITMTNNGDIRKRRIDFSGPNQQLTFSVEFKDPGDH
jgi:serine/threonine protein kinase